METADRPAAATRHSSDPVAVIAMLTATAIAAFAVTLYFAVLKRFSRQERGEVPVSAMRPASWLE